MTFIWILAALLVWVAVVLGICSIFKINKPEGE